MSTEPWSIEIGKAYLVETVTFYFTGRLVKITATDIVLDEAAKIFDTDRLSITIPNGPHGYFESEYLGDGHVIRQGAIVSYTPWPRKLPRTVEQK